MTVDECHSSTPREPTPKMVAAMESAAAEGIGHPVDEEAIPRVWRAGVDAMEAHTSPDDRRSSTFIRHDPVRKVRGYPFPGVVIAVFETLAGETRVVVECTILPGLLHIYSPEQLEYAR